MDYTTATLAQLGAEFHRLGAIVRINQNERKIISDIIEQRREQARLRTRITAMTAIQRDALRDVLGEFP